VIKCKYAEEVSLIKNISFQINDEFHIELKIQSTKEGKSIKDYIIELIKKDLENKKKE